MVTMRFTSLIIGFLFTLFVLRDSNANTQKALETSMVVSENGLKGTILSVDQEIFNGVPAVATTINNKLGGRKMVMNDVLRKEMMKEGELNQEISKISGATHSVGKCYHEGKGELNVECKTSHRSLPPVKFNMVGFIAFSADYHVPKPHPPKNN